ncbi:hypothetical protein F4811DRAFT_505103 [Daldinia bambusicola]|nr:hypothetical protein F4811DRAFT_505103 [Daldinia bambusicola]
MVMALHKWRGVLFFFVHGYGLGRVFVVFVAFVFYVLLYFCSLFASSVQFYFAFHEGNWKQRTYQSVSIGGVYSVSPLLLSNFTIVRAWVGSYTIRDRTDYSIRGG